MTRNRTSPGDEPALPARRRKPGQRPRKKKPEGKTDMPRKSTLKRKRSGRTGKKSAASDGKNPTQVPPIVYIICGLIVGVAVMVGGVVFLVSRLAGDPSEPAGGGQTTANSEPDTQEPALPPEIIGAAGGYTIQPHAARSEVWMPATPTRKLSTIETAMGESEVQEWSGSTNAAVFRYQLIIAPKATQIQSPGIAMTAAETMVEDGFEQEERTPVKSGRADGVRLKLVKGDQITWTQAYGVGSKAHAMMVMIKPGQDLTDQDKLGIQNFLESFRRRD